MHRALFAHTIRKSGRSHSLFQPIHQISPQIAYDIDASRYFTTLKPLPSGPWQLRCVNPIGIRWHNTSNRNDAVTKPNSEEAKMTKMTKKTKNKKSQKTKVTKVTPFSAKQTKATIQVIRAKQLSNFVGGAPFVGHAIKTSDINEVVEEPILVVPKQFPTKKVVDNDVIEGMLQSYQDFLRQPKTVKSELDAPNRAITDSHEMEAINKRKSQEESLIVNVKAYINACVNANMKMRALSTLRHLSAKHIQNIDIGVYTIVMHSYAAEGNWPKVKEVCDMLRRDGATFTPQVYAAICECIGRYPNSDGDLQQHLRECLNEAANQQITMNDILDKSKFVSDQREFVLNALYRIDCHFKPKYTAPVLIYTNPLLESLNENIAPIEQKVNNPAIESPPYKISNAKRGFSKTELRSYVAEQMENEAAGTISVRNISIEAASITDEVRACREKLDALLKQWEQDILKAFMRHLGVAQHKMQCKSSNRISICPYLKVLQPEIYVNILMNELKMLGEGSDVFSPTTVQLYRRLGHKVYSRYKIEQRNKLGVSDKVERLYTEYSETLCSGSSNDNPRQLWQRINYHERGIGPDIDTPEIVWPWPVLCDIGKFLLNILLCEIKIDANLMKCQNGACTMYKPVFFTTFRNRGVMLREELRPHPTLTKLFHASRKEYLTFATDLVPMVCPPIPWHTYKHGGYFTTQADLIRLPFESSSQHDRIDRMASPSDLYPSLDAINQLGCIPWRVNTRILDIIIGIFNSGGSDEFHVPKPPDGMHQMPDTSHLHNELDVAMATAKHFQDQADVYSTGCDTRYKLSLANHFRDKIFWLPHNMDFRGRVYPVPPHLNHLSSDLSRSLMYFHQEQPLGENGLNWLKLHCINLTGLKKRDSVQDRLAYAESIMDDIIESADNPLKGRKWWTTSDDPWQTLACCMEIANAIRSPDPVTYMSRFPIHQDGSCNGLQHYAALGRDKDGAISVNLAPSDAPQDVYSDVATLVETARAKDAKEGHAVAIALDGLIKRKVIKQTVMTTVYGVTPFGARLQIEKQLKTLDDFPRPLIKQASQYLALKTFQSLGTMFRSATEIQNWFTDCARFITKNHNKHVEWITPLGLPVVQPYTSKFNQNFKVLSVTNTRQSQVSDRYGKLNNLKEKNAFPPNFIHSLDSCHMMLTSVNCERAGITFVSVHDCFWTHANAVPVMNRICRDQFVLLHSQPILENLSKFFYEQYQKELDTVAKRRKSKATSEGDAEPNIFKQLPQTGEFNLKDVLDSVYFFS